MEREILDMIFLDIDKKKDINEVLNNETMSDKAKLLIKATIDKRLNTKDLKLYNYVMNLNLGYTQEEIADMLDMSRSNVNKSFEKLSALNYITKKSGIGKKGERASYSLVKQENAGICPVEPQAIMRFCNTGKVSTKDKFICFNNEEEVQELRKKRLFLVEDIEFLEAINTDERLILNDYKLTVCNVANFDLAKREWLIEQAKEHIKYSNDGKISIAKSFIENEVKSFKTQIEKIDESLIDTEKIEKDLQDFKNNFYKSVSTLEKSQIDELLEDDNIFLLLFILSSSDKRIKKFKNQYLTEYIIFLFNFTDLYEKKNFFKVYYEITEIKEIKLEELMKVFDIKHRDTPSSKSSIRKRIEKYIEVFLDNVDNINENKNLLNDKELESVKDIEVLVDEISCLLYEIKDTSISFESFIYAIYMSSLHAKFQSCYNISIKELLEIKNKECYNRLWKIYDIEECSKKIEKEKKEK